MKHPLTGRLVCIRCGHLIAKPGEKLICDCRTPTPKPAELLAYHSVSELRKGEA